MIGLGDGTEESHARMQTALDLLWPYVGEMFTPDAVDAEMAKAGIAPDPASLRAGFDADVAAVMERGDIDVSPTPVLPTRAVNPACSIPNIWAIS